MNTRERFKDLDWFDQTEGYYVSVGGSGGIGSWTIFLLARAGFSLHITDFDRIERHNIGGQLFSLSDVGGFKTDIMQGFVTKYAPGVRIIRDRNHFGASHRNNIIITAFDSMEARKTAFEVWKTHIETNFSVLPALFIDGRLSAEGFEIYVVDKNTDFRKYEMTLVDDAEIEDLPCTAKQTSHMAAMIASYIVGFLTNYLVNYKRGAEVREVPFKVDYFLPMNKMSVDTSRTLNTEDHGH